MRIIAGVLGSLDEPAARLRVMRWAAQKFDLEIGFTPVGGTVGTPSVQQEADVDDLHDIFDEPVAAERNRRKEPIDALACDQQATVFQRLTLGWRRA